jgi:hypothetical protein
MIIKIKTPGENNWRFYDKAQSVQTSEIPYSEVPKMADSGFSDQFGNYGFDNGGGLWEEILMRPDIPQADKVLLVSFTLGDISEGRAMNLYTNAESYILNDSGKTIERIY